MLTREEFVRKYGGRASGAVLDVLFRQATGGELALQLRRMMREFDATFAAAYDEMAPAPPAAANGAARPASPARRN